jgi:nucleoside-diphosphate-sugar epimerase
MIHSSDLFGTLVLITGASGFIGAHLTKRFRTLGADVHAVSRRRQQSRQGEVWHTCDLRDANATAELIDSTGPDAVFHLASEVDGARDLNTVRVTLENNLSSTVNVLTAAARKPNTRVMLTGSSEEPREGAGPPTAPSPYAMAKWAASGYAQLFHQLWGVPVTILRPTSVYGPGQRDTTKLVPYVTLSLLRGERPRLTSGAKRVDWIYVDDVVDAMVAAYQTEDSIGMSFDVGSGTSTSVRETADLLCDIVGGPVKPDFGALPDRPLDTPQTTDLAPAGQTLGWRPTVGLESGLRRAVRWYSDHPPT